MKVDSAPGAAPLIAVAQAPTPAASEPAPGAAPGPATSAAPVDKGPSAPADDKSGLRIGSYVAFGVGVAGLAVGTIFTMQSAGKRKDADSKFEACGGESGCRAENPLSKEADALDRDADSAMTLGIVGFAVGGVGIAAGTTLLILSSGSSNENAAGVKPYVGFGTAGIKGRF
jgi:hypothetical protein